MEQSISSLAFKGSIGEAIIEAKRQRKLFVVYISGYDAESICLENSTWPDLNLAESISKYCILLHIKEGSNDAAQFSALYPQKSVPCITAIGYNGVTLWQNEGFVSAEILASSLEKAWLSLHIQETTATFLTAALASRDSVPHASRVPDTVSYEQGSSSSTHIPASSTPIHVQSPEAGSSVNPDMIKESKGCEDAVEESDSKLVDKEFPKSVNDLESNESKEPFSSIEKDKESISPLKEDLNIAGVCSTSGGCDESTIHEENISMVVDYNDEASAESSRAIGNAANEDKKAKAVEKEKSDNLNISTSNSTDVHLNIRLPNGTSLQEKFPMTSTLRMVKDYVNENQECGIGSYDLAIPYPRKVFDNQDLSKTLSELGLFNRQALIVVPHRHAFGHHKGGSSSRSQANSTADVDSSNGSNEGYFGLVRRMLSYINPLSYLGSGGSSSNSAQESQSSTWQHSPNPTLQNNLRRHSTLNSLSDQDTPATDRNKSKSTQQSSSRFGSNIHTLRHDEDDSRFKDRNAFWNGNSTEYGGDNDGK